jgi:hypothetical protein
VHRSAALLGGSLWLAFDPSNFGIKQASLEYTALGSGITHDWQIKLPKQVWSSELALFFAVILIALISKVVSLYLSSRQRDVGESSISTLVILSSLAGVCSSLIFFCKFTIGGCMIVASVICLSILMLSRARSVSTSLVVLGAYLTSLAVATLLLLISLVGIEGLDDFYSQIFISQNESFGRGHGTVWLVKKSIRVFGSTLFSFRSSVFVLMVAVIVLIIISNRSRATNRIGMLLLAFSLALTFMVLCGRSFESNRFLVSVVATALLILVCVFGLEPEIDSGRRHPWLTPSTFVLPVFAFFSLLQIPPLGDGWHVWYADMPLLVLTSSFLADQRFRAEIREFLGCALAFVVCLQLVFSLTYLRQIRGLYNAFRGDSLVSGIKYIRSSSSAQRFQDMLDYRRDHPQSVSIALDGTLVLVELLPSNLTSLELSRCLRQPYVHYVNPDGPDKALPDCFADFVKTHKTQIILASTQGIYPTRFHGYSVNLIRMNGRTYGKLQ